MDFLFELSFLRYAVERKFAGRLSSTADFVRLSEDMDDRLSPSTLKRIWGYVGMQVVPRISTLDSLSRYAGFRDWRAFNEHLKETEMVSSGYFHSDRLDTAMLQEGDSFSIGWRPDRIVSLLYLGESRFRVTASVHSKLQVGDEFVATSIVKGFPLILPWILRGEETLDPYIAGRDGGIVFIKKA